MANGNVLITAANPTGVRAHFIEVDPVDNYIVWQAHLGEDGTDRSFDAQRVPGLYPQAFSITLPEFSPLIATPTIFLQVGPHTLEFKVFNDGDVDQIYDYQLTDIDNWFNTSGSITLTAGQSGLIQVVGTVYDVTYQDILNLTIEPRQAPNLAQSLDFEIYSFTLDVAHDSNAIPTRYALYPNHPNPFNPATTIRFDLPRDTELILAVYDVLGREVYQILSGYAMAGHHRELFYGRDRNGRVVPSGLYFARLSTPDFVKSVKMILLR